jgi:spermidine dehydrogenase
MSKGITRRDFIDGVACSVIAGSGLLPGVGRAEAAAGYPPGQMAMRGSRDADLAVAHALRDGARFRMEDYPISGEVDFAVVGAGIGGLSSAYFLRKARPKATVLIFDNHDDFGGHARRNEFAVDGRMLIGYGGSESIQSPGSLWSPTALGLLADLGVHLDRFEKAMDTPLYPGLGLSTGIFFPRETFGKDTLVAGDPQRSLPTDIPAALHHGRPIAQFAADCPLTDTQRKDLVRLYTEPRDVMAGLAPAAKAEALLKISYTDFLRKYWEVDPIIVGLFNGRTSDLYALPARLIPAAFLAQAGYPGFQGLGLPATRDGDAESERYIHHFPDGNASIARLLVRRLMPRVAPGTTMEDVVTARFAYEELDRDHSPVRLRLDSTVVAMRNAKDGVDVLYMRAGEVRRIRCNRAIYAGYYAMLPYLCPDVPPGQRGALALGVRSPLVYASVALRNWRPWVNRGVHLINNPMGFYSVAKLDYPVSLGKYRFARTADEPILVHLSHTPHAPQPLADRNAEIRAARQALYTRPFSDFEAALRDELTRMLGPGGFDADRDMAAITVNRWGHGYAHDLDPLTDANAPQDLPMLARSAIGRISLAGSDAAWTAYAHAAMDEAQRAVGEVLAPVGSV